MSGVFGKDCCCHVKIDTTLMVPVTVDKDTEVGTEVLPSFPRVDFKECHPRTEFCDPARASMPGKPAERSPLSKAGDAGDGAAGVASSAIQNLQKEVTTFAYEAIRGRQCKFINAQGVCLDTEYRLDSTLQHLMVFTPNSSSVEVQCNVGRIQDIYTHAVDGPSSFPPHVVRCAEHEGELENLIMTTFLDRKGVLSCFCLVEGSPDSRDAFLRCVRVLGIYARKRRTEFEPKPA